MADGLEEVKPEAAEKAKEEAKAKEEKDTVDATAAAAAAAAAGTSLQSAPRPNPDDPSTLGTESQDPSNPEKPKSDTDDSGKPDSGNDFWTRLFAALLAMTDPKTGEAIRDVTPQEIKDLVEDTAKAVGGLVNNVAVKPTAAILKHTVIEPAKWAAENLVGAPAAYILKNLVIEPLNKVNDTLAEAGDKVSQTAGAVADAAKEGIVAPIVAKKDDFVSAVKENVINPVADKVDKLKLRTADAASGAARAVAGAVTEVAHATGEALSDAAKRVRDQYTSLKKQTPPESGDRRLTLLQDKTVPSAVPLAQPGPPMPEVEAGPGPGRPRR